MTQRFYYRLWRVVGADVLYVSKVPSKDSRAWEYTTDKDYAAVVGRTAKHRFLQYMKDVKRTAYHELVCSEDVPK